MLLQAFERFHIVRYYFTSLVIFSYMYNCFLTEIKFFQHTIDYSILSTVKQKYILDLNSNLLIVFIRTYCSLYRFIYRKNKFGSVKIFVLGEIYCNGRLI